VAKEPLSLKIRCLSHANFALLRRNIVCFQTAANPYFAHRTNRPHGRPEGKKEVTAMIPAIVRFFREWHRYNVSIRELQALGDRELADIGISRSDIQRVAWSATHHG
jgi:uncharacterized protein YjiS (DUF1127 family)